MSIASRFVTLILPTAALALAAGCPAREVTKLDPDLSGEHRKEIPVAINRNLDILFVIDDSSSMQREQDSLTANFDRFIDVLETIEGGLPSVHIGVVSTDLGTGDFDTCDAATDDHGNLLGGDGCEGPSDAFIVDVGEPDGTRTKNYSGELGDAFSCIASLGIDGCGFEQPLEAMRRALDGNPSNAGFLRDDAYLMVVFITDEDDCSARDPQIFNPAASLDTIDSELGPLSSFRCFEFGVECEPDGDPRAPGPRQSCKPSDGSPYLHDVQEYVEFLKGLKDDPRQVIVTGIVGVPTPVEVTIGGSEGDVPSVVPSCQSSAGDGFPAVRLAAFLESFPERNTLTTICNEDLSDALVLVASILPPILGTPCLEGDLTDIDDATAGVQPDCSITDVVDLHREGEQETVLPSCEQSSTLPCWQVIAHEQCSHTATGLTLQVCRGLDDDDPGCPDGDAIVPARGTTTVVRCDASF